MKITVISICFVLIASVTAETESCHDRRTNNTLDCKCLPNEDLEVFYDGAHPVTSLIVSSCDSASLSPYMGNYLQDTLTSIIIKNISKTVSFCPLLNARSLSKIEFLNVCNLEEFQNECTFKAFTRLDNFKIKDTVIRKFEQIFSGVEVNNFILQNVMIWDLHGLDFSSINGSRLEIADSYIIGTEKTLTLQSFHEISIRNTTFEFPRGAIIVIAGAHVHLSNNIFLNASVNVMGNRSIHVSNTCAEGSGSAMRLESILGNIKSHNNRLPTAIVYKPNHTHSENFICPNTMCNCLPNKASKMKAISKGGFCQQIANQAKIIHQETSRGILLCFMIIASAIVARI